MMSFQRLDRPQWFFLSSQVPVLHELDLMHCVPLKNGVQHTTWKLTDDLPVLDVNRDLVVPVFGMKVRRRVVSIVHPNDDSEKTGNLRHKIFSDR